MKKLAWILLIVGGLNWLLVGLFGADLGVWLFGGMDSIVSKIIYILVGLSAIVAIFTMSKKCEPKGSSMGSESGM
jgi:uncharacterized membrane protein YuzA (DUF378 family)